MFNPISENLQSGHQIIYTTELINIHQSLFHRYPQRLLHLYYIQLATHHKDGRPDRLHVV